MYKGYRNKLYYKNPENNKINNFPTMRKCIKCQKYSPATHSPAFNNIFYCIYCGTPNYIITNK
jgi:hypothetical protein